MATRHVLLLALGFTFSFPAFVPTPAGAEEEANLRPQGHVENANFKFKGRAKSSVLVHSGPGSSFYPTIKLDEGDEVTVVAIKNDWLKILPPPGSFSYVPKKYVDWRGTGKVGRVTDTLIVRAGSSENMIKTTVQTKLVAGQDVTILGEQDEYYKITPPDGAYLFVHQRYIQPGGAGVAAKDGAEKPRPAPAPANPADETDDPAPGDEPDADIAQHPADVEQPDPDAAPDGRPSGATTPATAPKPAAAVDAFRKLEAEFEAASKQPVVDQPIERLTEAYTKLVNAGTLTGSMRRMADARLMALRMRADAREQLQAFRKSQAEMLDRRRELEGEQQELQERIAQTQVKLYAAVGVLRVSSLQRGGATLYRLTDPGTGRTVVYLRSNDRKLPGLLNQFVGVRGDVTTDERQKMKVIAPSVTEPVDPSKVNDTVIATITPPSMVTTSVSVDPGEAAVAE